MKLQYLLILSVFSFWGVHAQNLHTHANAASISNEANATTGWGGGAVLSSTATDVQNGSFSILIASSGVASGRTAEYTFNVVNGTTYNITIWAKRGDQSFLPAFANWSGFAGFSTTNIGTNNWTAYNFTLTANANTATIRIYTSPSYRGSISGDSVLIDGIVISTNDTAAPSAVTDLAATGTTATATNLNWTAATDNVGVTDYEVFQDGGSIGLSGGTTTFVVNGLASETNYAFTVVARDAAGNTSAVSNTANVITLSGIDTEAPSTVTDLAASGTTPTATNLNWTAATDNVGVTDYEVFQDGVSIGLSGGTNTFAVNGLTAATNYAFTVVAQDAAGNTSVVSNTADVTTLSGADTEAPTAVTDLAATGTTATATNLNWTAATDNVGVTDYEVFQDGASIGLSGGNTTFAVNGLTAATNYAFTVVAQDTAGNTSAVSNTANVTTLSGADTAAPSAVTDLAATGTTATATNLNWTAATDNVGVTDYEVFQDGVSIGLSGGTTTFAVNGLTSETTYAFTVVVQDAAGNTSAVSNAANVTTLSGGTGGITDYTSENANLNTVDWQANNFFADGNVGIGTNTTLGYRLAVAGNIVAEEVRVALQGNWPDYVFENSYNLPSLEEVENHIKKNKHLIDIPRANSVEKDGILLGNMDAMLLRKIEELTLYTIQQEKKIKKLEEENCKIKELQRRLEILELKSNK
ncbi:fibronectin type III domain-containing protein [Galbibacter sp. BG1]|uniref:fibronectin type III domain-containing protein n=1 Tax=Galbibacter sp. BG1 TaxID=1170699 RepID=UPI0015BE5A12|nr:fibronectin type III domain-containing protein [Galbibacter sp. BG1]QLE02503.1 fibronectin type III domain-containing protein [Galbibacter sp. BG1]